MSDLKVEGKVADFCPKCKNCKSTTRECDGEKDWLTEVECEDPYDGMIKTLAADSDICCSMFTPKPDRACAKCERFDGTYCHGPNGTITISYKALFGEPVNCPSFEEKKARESEESRIEELIKASKRKDDLIQNYREELKGLKEANENLLEKCKVYIDEKAELKLKVDKLQSNINFQKYLKDEAYKREDKLKKELNKVKAHDEALTKHFQNDEKLIDSIQKVIFPQEEGSDYTYSYDEILNKVKELKVQADEDKTMDKVMYEDLEYWKERCHKAETDVTTLNSKVEVLKNKSDKYLNKIINQQTTHYKQCARILELENMVSKLQSGEYDDILAKDIEIKSLQAKYEDAMAGWKGSIDTDDRLQSEIDKLKNENISLNTINKGLAEDLRSAKDKLNYLYFKAKEFTDMEESNNE